MRTAKEHIEAWCRFRNDGYIGWPGPDGMSNPGEDVFSPPKEDVASYNLVNRVIEKVGKGALHPSKLVDLLDHVFLNGGKVDTFQLMLPWAEYPKEIVLLGFRKEQLLKAAIVMVVKSVEVEAKDSQLQVAS